MNRRNFLKNLAYGAALLSVSPLELLANNPQNITFQDAKKNPVLRQAYVKQMAGKILPLEYVGKVYYVPRNTTENGGMAIANYNVGEIPSRKKYNIEVCLNAFNVDVIQNDNDFLSALLDHEIDGHAKNFHYGFSRFKESDFMNGPASYNGTVLKAAFELEADGNQLTKTKERKVSEQMLTNTTLCYFNSYSDLYHPSASNINEQGALERLRVEYFISELLKMTLTLDFPSGVHYHGRIITSDGSLMTNNGPIQPNQELSDKIKYLQLANSFFK